MAGEVERLFPILPSHRHEKLHRELGVPRSVPWSLLAPHEAQARRNHSQSLTRLAERGGLSLCEIIAVLEDRDWHSMDEAAAFARLRERLRIENVEREGRDASVEREALAALVAFKTGGSR